MTVFGIAPGQPEIHGVGHGFNARESSMKKLERVTDRDEEPTSWLATTKAESAELREMLRKAVAETAERAHTVSGRRKSMAFLGAMYQHSVNNHHIADRASEVGNVELTIVVSEMQQIIDGVVIRLEEILAAPPASTRSRRESAHQPVVGQ